MVQGLIHMLRGGKQILREGADCVTAAPRAPSASWRTCELSSTVRVDAGHFRLLTWVPNANTFAVGTFRVCSWNGDQEKDGEEQEEVPLPAGPLNGRLTAHKRRPSRKRVVEPDTRSDCGSRVSTPCHERGSLSQLVPTLSAVKCVRVGGWRPSSQQAGSWLSAKSRSRQVVPNLYLLLRPVCLHTLGCDPWRSDRPPPPLLLRSSSSTSGDPGTDRAEANGGGTISPSLSYTQSRPPPPPHPHGRVE